MLVCVLQHYLANDQKLKKYVPLIKDSIVYPAIYDSRRTLLSLPPIINGAHSAVSWGYHGCKGDRAFAAMWGFHIEAQH